MFFHGFFDILEIISAIFLVLAIPTDNTNGIAPVALPTYTTLRAPVVAELATNPAVVSATGRTVIAVVAVYHIIEAEVPSPYHRKSDACHDLSVLLIFNI